MRILVYGWYGIHTNNFGDLLFKDSFVKLFPEHTFTFVDHISASAASAADALFFGGGSFLNFNPSIDDGVLDIISQKPIFYLGIGAETEISPIHQQLLTAAKFIAIRNQDQASLDKIRALNPNTIYAPDLVYYLASIIKYNLQEPKDRILVMPNFAVVPQYYDPHYKQAAWNYFKCEFAQFLDRAQEDGYGIDFLPLCNCKGNYDRNAAIEILNHMKPQSSISIMEPMSKEQRFYLLETIEMVSSYKLVITQRYHGIILSELAGTPYISLYHHDKLKSETGHIDFNRRFMSYYGVTKSALLDESYRQNGVYGKVFAPQPIEQHIYTELVERVNKGLMEG